MRPFTILVTVFLFVKISGSVPSFFKICSRDDSELNDCLKEAVSIALPILSGGFNESNIYFPPLDPYKEKEMRIDYHLNQINVNAILYNITAIGLSRAKVHNVRAYLLDDSLDLEFDMSNEKVYVEGKYRVEGKFNVIRLSSNGKYNTTMKDLTWKWKIKGTPQVKNGITYMVVNYFSMRPEVGSLDFHIPSLVPRSPTLNEYVLRLLKDNWKVIYYELLPIVEKTWSRIGMRACNRIFKKIPYDTLFPPEF